MSPRPPLLCCCFLLRYSICLTVLGHAVQVCLCLGETTPGNTQCPFAAVRETTSLKGERAQQAAYSLPSQRFSLALSFPHSPLSLGERADQILSHDFLRKTGSFPFCGASWKRAKHDRPPRGMGKKESGGLGEKTQKGKGDKHDNAPPFHGVVSPSIFKEVVARITVNRHGCALGLSPQAFSRRLSLA